MPRRYRYNGILNRPMRFAFKTRNALRGDLEVDSAALEQQFLERFKALEIDCGIDLHNDPDWRAKVETGEPWHTIAMVLMKRHIPGFSILKGQAENKRSRREAEDTRFFLQMSKLIGKGLKARSAADLVVPQVVV